MGTVLGGCAGAGRLMMASVDLDTPDTFELLAQALAGEVLTELPPFLAQQEVDAGALVRVLPRHPFPEVAVTAVLPERRHTSALVRTYVEFCAARAPALLATSWSGPRQGDAASR